MSAALNALREEGTKADCLAALERALAREAALRMSESQVRWALANHELSSAELKLAEKHCDWSAFKHAFNAVMSARAAAADVLIAQLRKATP